MGRKHKHEMKNVAISASIRADQDAMLGELNMSRSRAIQHAIDQAYGAQLRKVEMAVKISISLPMSLLSLVDALRGDETRSLFIREAILERIEK